MNQQFTTALIRAVLTSLFTAGSAFFAPLAAGSTVAEAGIAAGAVFFATMGARFAAEGFVDTKKPTTT